MLKDSPGKQLISDQLFFVEYLNIYSTKKRNFYILNHSGDKSYRWIVNSKLSMDFNLISIFYDLHRSHTVEKFAENFLVRLKVLIEPCENSVVMGHSFNGYLAHQLASIIPGISYCILIDAYNFFEPEDPNQVHGWKQVLKLLTKHIIKNRDFSLPLYMPAMWIRNVKNKKSIDQDFFDGMDYLKDSYINYPAINNCIYFQAARSRAGMNNHGLTWRRYVTGNFYLFNINEDHIGIVEKKSTVIVDHIRLLCS